MLGAFKSYPVFGAIAASGALFSVIYMLWMYQQVMFGPVDKQENKQLLDLNGREIATLLPIAVLIIVMGIFPGLFLRQMDASAEKYIQRYQVRYQAYKSQVEDDSPKMVRLDQLGLASSHPEILNFRIRK